MGFVEAVQTCFSKYFDFTGRARRSEFWYFILFLVIVSIVIALVEMMIFGAPSETGLMGAGTFAEAPFSNLFSLATLVPSLSVTARRLHDTGKSGWFQLLPIVPAILMMLAMGASGSVGAIGVVLALVTLATCVLLIVWCATDSHPGDNQYGPNPK